MHTIVCSCQALVHRKPEIPWGLHGWSPVGMWTLRRRFCDLSKLLAWATLLLSALRNRAARELSPFFSENLFADRLRQGEPSSPANPVSKEACTKKNRD